jgi:uncharacterized SAM-binding protein YcdF (DUF218 family)
MPRSKKYLTADGVNRLIKLAGGEHLYTNKAVAGFLKITERAYQYLVSAKKDQTSISVQVRSWLSTLGFTEHDFECYTSDQKQQKAKKDAKHVAQDAGIIVRNTPIADVEALRRIPRETRIQLYEKWRSAVARYDAPEGRAMSEEHQKDFQKSLRINLAPLRTLLRTIGLREWDFQLPMDSEDFRSKHTSEHLKQFRTKVFKSITKFIAEADEPSKERITALLKSVTEYLCKEHPLRAQEAADFAFVPGYRSHLRAELAGELFSKGLVRKIYLSGHSPFYAKNEDKPLPLTEALAMAVYLRDVRSEFRINWDDLVIETGAHCTHQNVNFSEHAFAEAAAKKQGLLTVLIVTSPYHLRRTWLMLQHLNLHRPNIFGVIKRVAAGTKVGLGKHEWHTNQDGVTAYMTEYWKIHGGRVVGEF